jgi:hypothetical protein
MTGFMGFPCFGLELPGRVRKGRGRERGIHDRVQGFPQLGDKLTRQSEEKKRKEGEKGGSGQSTWGSAFGAQSHPWGEEVGEGGGRRGGGGEERRGEDGRGKQTQNQQICKHSGI